MEKRPLVSIVVPVYNAEKTLDRCLASIRAQTWREIEVLLVDDGSTDGSAARCRAWCEKDSRFRLIEKERNSGVADSRNRAIAAAAGQIPPVRRQRRLAVRRRHRAHGRGRGKERLRAGGGRLLPGAGAAHLRSTAPCSWRGRSAASALWRASCAPRPIITTAFCGTSSSARISYAWKRSPARTI